MRRVLRQVNRYEFRTFSVGVTIPEDVQEREDQLRSDLQIRGRETVKAQMAREVATFIERVTRKHLDRRQPELTILADFSKGEVSAMSKSLFVSARYTKPRGVLQRREFCEKCGGRGCEHCDAGYSRTPSMEGVIGGRFGKILRSTKARFTWMGSEDKDSIVYPPGRPFIAELKDPKHRKIPSRLSVVTGKGGAAITNAKVLRARPAVIPTFVFRTRAFIEPAARVDASSLARARELRKAVIRYRNNKGKLVEKRVYSVRVEKRRRGLVADIRLDGGLPVKRLISGESVSPSLSEVLGVPLVCQRFDILRVGENRPVKTGSAQRLRR